MLPSEVIVETVDVALSRPTLVVRFDNALLFTVPVIGYDTEVYLSPKRSGVLSFSFVRCTAMR